VKIALVANTSWNLYNFRQNIIHGLLDKGCDVLCIAPEDDFTIELKKLPITFESIRVHSKGNNPVTDVLLIKQLHRIFRKHQPTVILQYTIKPNIYGTIAAALCRIPTINTVTGLGTVFLHNTVVSKVAQQLYAISFKFAARVVFQNEDDKQLFATRKLVHPGKTKIIKGSGINTSYFIPEHYNAMKLTDKPFRFLMVARLLFDKGIQEFAEAAKRLKELHGTKVECVLIGAVDSDKNLGIRREQLSEWTQKHQLVYKEFSNPIINEYHEATAVVLPSYREGLSKSLLEAASCSLPLIATNVPGCKEVVIDGWNGYLCEPKSSDDLFLQMNHLFLDTLDKIHTMGKNSRFYVEENFSDKIIFNDYFCLIEQVVAEKRSI
jgi:glycosyltransferase involved in cell wall biosynthesis